MSRPSSSLPTDCGLVCTADACAGTVGAVDSTDGVVCTIWCRTSSLCRTKTSAHILHEYTLRGLLFPWLGAGRGDDVERLRLGC